MGNGQGVLVSSAFIPLIENNKIIDKEKIIEKLEEKLTCNDSDVWNIYKDTNKLNIWRTYYEENYLKQNQNAYEEALKYIKKH